MAQAPKPADAAARADPPHPGVCCRISSNEEKQMTLILVGLASGMLLIFAASVIQQRSEFVALDADESAVHDLRKTSEVISSC